MTDSTLNQYISRGTNAERVAFTPSPPTPGSGNHPSYVFYETDTTNTYMWDGSAWQKVNNSSGSVTTTGSPASGKLAKFSGAATITNGDLTGDVTTSGGLATTLATSGVTAGTYGDSSHTLTLAVDAKGRVTSVSTNAVGGSAWALVGAGQTATGVYDFAVDGAKANINFTGLGSYNELLVVARNLTDGTSGVREIQVSVDNGSTFFTTAGDYVQLNQTGVETGVTAIAFHGTAATSARTIIAHILNTKGTEKYCEMQSTGISQIIFVASSSDINAIRVNNSAGGNITGGTVRVYGR